MIDRYFSCPETRTRLQNGPIGPHSQHSSLHWKNVAMPCLRYAVWSEGQIDSEDIAVIALYLGHESMETTHIYLEADLAMKERALASIAPDSTPLRRFRNSEFSAISYSKDPRSLLFQSVRRGQICDLSAARHHLLTCNRSVHICR